MTAAEKPLVIPLFIPHSGCSHQCVYCNQTLITGTGKAVPDASDISKTIQAYLGYRGRRSRVEAAFFGGNFLGLPAETITRLLSCIQPWIEAGEIHSIRFSTRPDTVRPQTLDLIRSCNVSMVELGAQSLDDAVLTASGRGHTARDTAVAVQRLRERDIGAGLQLMVGLPRDTPQSLMKSTAAAAALRPDIVRIYPLLVMAGAPLEKIWRKGRYQPLSLEKAIGLVKQMVRVFSRWNIPVVRTGLQASDLMADAKKVLAGPWHPAFGHLVFSSLMADQMRAQVDADPALKLAPALDVHVHPASESRVRGDKNQNLENLYTAYGYKKINIIRDDRLDRSSIKVKAAHEIF